MDREKLPEDILAYLDGQLTEAEERDLAARIRGNDQAERLLAELMRLHGSVPTVLGEMTSEAAVQGPRRRLRSTRPQPPRTMVWVLAAVGAVAAVLLIAVLSSSPAPRPEPRPISRPPVKVEEPPPAPPKETPPPPPAPKPLPEPPKEAPRETPKPEPEKPKVPPSPAPPPPKPEPTPPPAPPTITAIAKIERVKGDVSLREGDLLPDQGVETRTGETAVRFPDQSLVELAADTRIRKITNGSGKRIVLDLGTITAQVTKQPAGQAMVFETPHAEARVLGTKLTLIVSAASTRLEVREGRVRLTRRSDGASTDVGAGYFAIASEGPRPAAKRIPPVNARLLLSDDFEDAAATGALWTLGDKLPGVKTARRFELDLVPRGQARPEGWGGTGLRTKAAFAPAIAVSADVEIQDPSPSFVTAISFVPNQGDIIRVQLRDNRYGLWQQIEPARELAGAARRGTGAVKERWKVELDGAVVRFLVNDRELLQHKHDLPVSDGYKVDLNSAARQDAPPGTRASFDNAVIEKLRP